MFFARIALLISIVIIGLPVAIAKAEDLEIRGRIMIDHSNVDGVHNNHQRGSEWEIRRARLGIKHKPKGDWQAELELNVDHAKESVDIADGYLRYDGWQRATLIVGRKKEPFGLENSTSSLNISTMERSMVTEAFAPGRSYGVTAEHDTNLYSWAAGLYSSGEEDDAGLDGYALTARATLSPINEAEHVAHFGVSGSVRDLQGNSYDINDTAEVNTADSIIESQDINAKTTEQISLEGALVYQRASLQTEWMQQKVEHAETQDTNDLGGEYSGHYILASLFLTADSRPYDAGSFDGVKPSSSHGAWELVARYSDITLGEAGSGTEAESLLLGVNYYATNNTRFMLNVARADVLGTEVEETGQGDALSFRLQHEF